MNLLYEWCFEQQFFPKEIRELPDYTNKTMVEIRESLPNLEDAEKRLFKKLFKRVIVEKYKKETIFRNQLCINPTIIEKFKVKQYEKNPDKNLMGQLKSLKTLGDKPHNKYLPWLLLLFDTGIILGALGVTFLAGRLSLNLIKYILSHSIKRISFLLKTARSAPLRNEICIGFIYLSQKLLNGITNKYVKIGLPVVVGLSTLFYCKPILVDIVRNIRHAKNHLNIRKAINNLKRDYPKSTDQNL